MKIPKREYNRVKSLQKLSFTVTVTVFKGVNGKYYACSKRGAESLREIFEFQKTLRKDLTEQLSLVD